MPHFPPVFRTCIMEAYRNILGPATSHCAGEMLAVSVVDTSQPQNASVQLQACAGCPIYQLAMAPELTSEHSSAHASARGLSSTSDAEAQTSAANPPSEHRHVRRVAVRHALGVTVFHLKLRPLAGTLCHGDSQSPSSCTPAGHASLEPKWNIQAAGNIADVKWNPFLPGELLYVCHDRTLFSLLVPSSHPKSYHLGSDEEKSAAHKAGNRKTEQHRERSCPSALACIRVVRGSTREGWPQGAQAGEHACRMSIACAGGARRVFLGCQQSLLVGEVRCRHLAMGYRCSDCIHSRSM
jgi:hypothetical protein